MKTDFKIFSKLILSLVFLNLGSSVSADCFDNNKKWFNSANNDATGVIAQSVDGYQKSLQNKENEHKEITFNIQFKNKENAQAKLYASKTEDEMISLSANSLIEKRTVETGSDKYATAASMGKIDFSDLSKYTTNKFNVMVDNTEMYLKFSASNYASRDITLGHTELQRETIASHIKNIQIELQSIKDFCNRCGCCAEK